MEPGPVSLSSEQGIILQARQVEGDVVSQLLLLCTWCYFHQSRFKWSTWWGCQALNNSIKQMNENVTKNIYMISPTLLGSEILHSNIEPFQIIVLTHSVKNPSGRRQHFELPTFVCIFQVQVGTLSFTGFAMYQLFIFLAHREEMRRDLSYWHCTRTSLLHTNICYCGLKILFPFFL